MLFAQHHQAAQRGAGHHGFLPCGEQANVGNVKSVDVLFRQDGVEDFFDGFPDDPERWADTDRDGIEDAMDDVIDVDGIANEDELASGTFPYKADSDADGRDDPAELAAGTDPLDPLS